MKHTAKVGTDVASLCYFDPAALPVDFDERIKTEQHEVFEAAVLAGQLVWLRYDSDGGYLIQFYIDEPVPAEVIRSALKPLETARLQVPSGTLWACGAEYACRKPIMGRLARYPQMGESFSLPPGDYVATTWPIEWPDRAAEEAIARAIGPDAALRRKRRGTATACCIATTFALGLGLTIGTVGDFAMPSVFPPWLLYGWLLLIIPLLGTVALTRSSAQFDREHGVDQIEQAFPSFVVQLRRIEEIGT